MAEYQRLPTNEPPVAEVAVDGVTIAGNGTYINPLRVVVGGRAMLTATLANGEGVTLFAGQPVTTIGGMARLANASPGFASLATVSGIVIVTAGATLPVSFATTGALSLEPDMWDLVTGDSGGLIPDATYYLDASAGRLTTTPPTMLGASLVEVGRAFSSRVMAIATLIPLLL
jgi:hypothetical protein